MKRPKTASKAWREIAREWEVDPATLWRWRQRFGDAVVRDDEALAGRLLRSRGASDSTLKRCRALLAIVPGDLPPEDVGVEAVIAIDDLPELAKRTTRHLDEAEQDLRAARASRDLNAETEARRAYREWAATLVSVRRTQASLGQESGDLIAKSVVLQIVHAWASRAALGMQRIRDILCPRVLNLKDESTAAGIIDDVLITELFLSPFSSAIHSKSGCEIPEWFVNEIARSVGDTISNGEQELKNHKESNA